MGDNPTNSQGTPALLDFSTQNILLGANQLPSMAERVLNYDDTQQNFNTFNTETVFASFSIPANTLGIRGFIRLSVWMQISNTSGSSDNITIYFNVGGSRIATDVTAHSTGVTGLYLIELLLKERTDTAKQVFVARVTKTNTVTNFLASGFTLQAAAVTEGACVLTVDTTVPVLISISGNPATINANIAMNKYIALTELYLP